MPSNTYMQKYTQSSVTKNVKRNCSGEETRKDTYQEYKNLLLNRGYSEKLINEGIASTEKIPRERLFGQDTDQTQEHAPGWKYPLIIKFNPRLPPMSKFINENLHILSPTPETDKLFNKSTVFTSCTYNMEQNILSMVTKNRFKQKCTQEVGVANDFGCFGCVLCKVMYLVHALLGKRRNFHVIKNCSDF